MSKMSKVYYDEVVSNQRSWKDVPYLWRKEVWKALDDSGYIRNSDGTLTPPNIQNEGSEVQMGGD